MCLIQTQHLAQHTILLHVRYVAKGFELIYILGLSGLLNLAPSHEHSNLIMEQGMTGRTSFVTRCPGAPEACNVVRFAKIRALRHTENIVSTFGKRFEKPLLLERQDDSSA